MKHIKKFENFEHRTKNGIWRQKKSLNTEVKDTNNDNSKQEEIEDLSKEKLNKKKKSSVNNITGTGCLRCGGEGCGKCVTDYGKSWMDKVLKYTGLN